MSYGDDQYRPGTAEMGTVWRPANPNAPDPDWADGAEVPVIRLPHRCDEWVIGSPDDARALIADLEVLIAGFDSWEPEVDPDA